MSQTQSFLQGLFDFSFGTFITQKLIKVIYGLGMVLLGGYGLVIISAGFRAGFTYGITTLVFTPIGFIAAVIVLRIYLELAIVLFRIADNTSQMARGPEAGQGEAPHTP